tara:strand:+ start:3312 stop:4007 length:696 start_codon:yes stop_codon:yes gene_type:complete
MLPSQPRATNASTVEQICIAIENGIIGGQFIAGQRLTEAALTKQLGVSRGPLREALRRLETTGLIVMQANRGAMVRKLSRKDITDRFQLRAVLEGHAAARVTARLDEPGVRDIMSTLWHEIDSLQQGRGSRSFIEHNNTLHKALILHCGNALLAQQWQQLLVPMLYFSFLRNPDLLDIAQSLDEHRQIIEAIVTGDETRAEKAAQDHILRSHHKIQLLPDAEFDRIFNYAR